jgi:hypothetical protein
MCPKPLSDEELARFTDAWLAEAKPGESDNDIAKALGDYIVGWQQLVCGVTPGTPNGDVVQAKTLERLRNPDILGPTFSMAEGVFRRLGGTDPAAGIRYLAAHIDDRSAIQSKRARASRPGSRDSITKAIESLLKKEPNISAKMAVSKLIGSGLIRESEGMIVHDDGSCVAFANFASRFSDAKKRLGQKDSG